MKKFLLRGPGIIVGLGLALFLIGTIYAQTGNRHTIEGRVQNLTAGAKVPSGLTVTLFIFSGMEPAGRYTTTVDAEGTYRIDNVMAAPTQPLFARAVYQGISYLSPVGIVQDDQLTLTLPISIAETTETPPNLRISRLHWIISLEGDQLQVAESYQIENLSDRTYLGRQDNDLEERETLHFPLPPGAGGPFFFESEDEERYTLRDNTLIDHDPVLPGPAEGTVDFQYRLPYIPGMTLPRKFNYPLTGAVLILVGDELKAGGAGLGAAQSQETSLGPTTAYEITPPGDGTTLNITLGPRSVPVTRSPLREIGIGLLVLAGSLIGIYALWRPAPVPPPAVVQPQLAALIALDDDLAAGKIPEALYHLRRQELKREIEQILL